MSKPEFWWCEKSERGKLIYWTVAKTKKDVIFYHTASPKSIVRIRVEEVPKGGRRL